MSTGTAKRISIIVLTWNKKQMLERCLQSIVGTVGDRPDVEVLVVDNGSTDGTGEFVKERFPQFRLARIARNAGVSGGLNAGLSASSSGSEFFVLLNNDLELHGDWLDALMAPAVKDPSVGIVGCKLMYPSGRVQHAGGMLGGDLRPGHIGRGEPDAAVFDRVVEMPFVTGAVMLLRRSVYESIGGFDTGYAPYLFEDLDLCVRARRAGFRIMYTGSTDIVHFERATLEADRAPSVLAISFRNHLRFILLNYSAGRLARVMPKLLARDLAFTLRTGDAAVLLRAWLATFSQLPSTLARRASGAARWPLMD